MQKYPKDVRIAFRHQPLPFHNHAMEAAEASMAANAQGKFWEMHDKLFANQQKLDRADLDGYAKEIGLDMNRFKADMDGHKHKDQIEADSKAGTSWGANGTPTLFVNGRQIVGAQPFSAFQPLIDEEIKHADKLLGEGVKMDGLYQKILDTLPAAPTPTAAPTQGANDNGPAKKYEIAIGDSPVKGPKNAPVTIMEFSDFQ